MGEFCNIWADSVMRLLSIMEIYDNIYMYYKNKKYMGDFYEEGKKSICFNGYYCNVII